MKIMKRIAMLFCVLFLLCAGNVNAANSMKIYLYDEPVDMDNPIIVNGNTLVPLRALFEQLGSTVSWNDQNKTVTANKGDDVITIQVGNTSVSHNGKTETLEEPAQIINDKTYVPLRFVAESFNQDVRWDKDNNAIYIGKKLDAKEIAKLISPSVVYIEINAYDGNVYSGSGFIVDKAGTVVTNYHVIDGAKTGIIKLTDGSMYEINNVINYDAKRDIAILKISANKSFPAVTLGDSDKNAQGDDVFAIGSPLGYQNSITGGLISNPFQTVEGMKFIQTSAPISHGNSGGPLINFKGEVVGINTLTRVDGQNINFAIPINDYKNMNKSNLYASLEQVYEYQHVIKYNDGAIYVGDKQNNLPDGYGTLTWGNGNKYTGQFQNGEITGKGKLVFTNGASYEGDLVNGMRQGSGKDIDIHGNIIEGEFSNNLPNGNGYAKFANGDSWVGSFANGMMTVGIYTFANGNSMKGYWAGTTFVPNQ